MTVNSISTDNSWLSQLSQQNNINTATKTNGQESAGAAHTRGHGFLNAIVQALSDIGVGNGTGTSTNSGTSSSSQDPAQALASFIQSLMAALHAQGNQASGSQGGADNDGDSDGSGSGVGGREGLRGNIATNVQSLIQQLTATGTGSTSNSGTTTANGTDTTLSSLQQSYQNLLGVLSNHGSGASSTSNLTDFLQAFSSKLNDTGPNGNVVSTQA